MVLRRHVVQLRTMLRFAKDPRTEAGLKEFIVRRRGAAGGAGTIKVNAVSDLSGGDSIQM